MRTMSKKDRVKMVFRTIGLIALGLILSSLTPIAYGPLAVIAAPWCLGVMIWTAIELNKYDIDTAQDRAYEKEKEYWEKKQLIEGQA